MIDDGFDGVTDDRLEFSCPGCGERNQVQCDPGDAGQWLVQDCRVCCQPIEIHLPGLGHPEFLVRLEQD